MRTSGKFAAAGQRLQMLEAYAERPGLLQRSPVMYKVLFTLCYLVTVISMPRYNWPGLIPFIVYPVLTVNLLGLPWCLFLQRLLVVLPFVVLLGGVNIFVDDRTIYFAAGFSMDGGWASFITLALKAFLTVGAVLLLVAGTPLNAVAVTLTHLYVPCILVMQLMLTWRYAGLLTQEAGNMYAAYQLRGGSGRGVHIQHWPQFAGLFLLRGLGRAQMVSRAMNCRLFDVRQIQYEKPAHRVRPVLCWLAACGLCVVLRMWI